MCAGGTSLFESVKLDLQLLVCVDCSERVAVFEGTVVLEVGC